MNTRQTRKNAFLVVVGFTILLSACTPPEPEEQKQSIELEKRPQTTQPIPELRQRAELERAAPKADAIKAKRLISEPAVVSMQARESLALAPGNIRIFDRPSTTKTTRTSTTTRSSL